jgi:membrane-associated phospholipid phosphatase
VPRALRTPLLVAGAGLAGLVLVWLAAYHGGPLRSADGWVFERAQEQAYRAGINGAGELLLVPMQLPLYVLLCGWALLSAWRHRGAATTAAVAFVLLGANGITQVLKEVTAAERPWSTTYWGSDVSVVSWPSGHATAAAALVVAFVLAAKPANRWVVARLGVLWSLFAGLAVVWLGWHMPSDTVGAWCVVALVTGVAVAGLRAWGTVRAPRRRRHVAPAQSSV